MGDDGCRAAAAGAAHHGGERRQRRFGGLVLALGGGVEDLRDEIVGIERQHRDIGDALADQRAHQRDIGVVQRDDDRQAGPLLAQPGDPAQRGAVGRVGLDHQHAGQRDDILRHRRIGRQRQQVRPAKALVAISGLEPGDVARIGDHEYAARQAHFHAGIKFER